MLQRLGLSLFLLLFWQAQGQAECRLDAPTSLPAPAHGELLVATQNAWLLHDSRKDFQYDTPVPASRVQARIDALAAYIIHRLASPHLLALQEVENRQLLTQLTAAIRAQGGPAYEVHLLPANDVAGNAVALLSRAPVVVARVQSLFAGQVVPGSRRAELFSRLPLLATLSQPLAMQVLVVHLRSAQGLDDRSQRARVLAKRRGQTQALIRWARQQKGDWLVLGDFNSGPGQGDFSLTWQQLQKAGWQEAQAAAKDDNYSYVYRCHKQQLDHVYLSAGLLPTLVKTAFAHGNAGNYRDLYAAHGSKVVSDHDGLGVYLRQP